jgi:DNA-binding NtrC family response regulator
MAPAHQAKILRLLENREGRRLGSSDCYQTDARFVASTHEEPGAAVRAGRLREDLYYRLAQDAVLEVPPLRDRLEDLPLLAQRFLAELGPYVLTPPAMAVMDTHSWPGNVRELRAVARTAARLSGPPPAAVGAKEVREALARIALAPQPTKNAGE